jgi:hypothetical protein
MDNSVNAMQGVRRDCAIREVAMNELDLPWWAAGALSRAQIVEDYQLIRAGCRQMLDEIGSNKTSTPRYE